MTFSASSRSYGELSTIWLRVFYDASEMFSASTQVVGHRTARMAMAGPLPNSRDRTEFDLMHHEKVDAAKESVRAISSGLMSLSVELALETSRNIWATSSSALALGSSRSAAQWLERQTALLKIATAYPSQPLHLAHSAAHLVQDGLAPIHIRATANAKRLGAF